MKPNPESGNVFFIILIAVTLLAALAYAVSQGNQGSVKGLSDERARLYATEIMEYSAIVSKAVAMLRLRGCADTEISFENDIVTGYTNGTNTACQVFHPSGGGISWSTPPESAINGTATASLWLINATHEIQDIGTTGSADENVDLGLFLDDLSLSVCTKINDLLGVGNTGDTPPTEYDYADDDKFTGSFSYDETISDDIATLEGKKSACFYDDDDNEYVFYKTLIAR